MRHRFAGYLVFARLFKPIRGIQGVSMHQFGEELSGGLLVTKTFQAYWPCILLRLSINGCRLLNGNGKMKESKMVPIEGIAKQTFMNRLTLAEGKG
jgi:hypothetical protein